MASTRNKPPSKNPRSRANAERQYPLLPASPTNTNWSDVPDAVILDLVRSFSDNGDAILFGKSQDQSVLAIRVYRHGQGYSVYIRGIERLGEAVDRLYRMHPPRERKDARASAPPLAVQVSQILPLPFHPLFTRQSLIKQREKEEKRYNEWNRLVNSFQPIIHDVAEL